MKEIEISEIKIVVDYILNEIKDKKLFDVEYDTYVNKSSDFMIDFINTKRSLIGEYIQYIFSCNKNNNLDKQIFKEKFDFDLVGEFMDFVYDCEYNNDIYDDEKEYEKERYMSLIHNKSLDNSIDLLEKIYNLTIEYSLFSPFERESIKCFGKNFFSGEEYNTTEFRELS